MAEIHMEKEVRTTPAELIRRIHDEALSHPAFSSFVQRFQVAGDRIELEGSLGRGRIEARPGRLVVDLTLEGAASLFKGVIEGKLRELFDRIE